MHRFVIGLLAPRVPLDARRVWNHHFLSLALPWTCEYYHAVTKEDLEYQLSTMVSLGRLGAMIHPSLSTLILPLLDSYDMPSLSYDDHHCIDTIVNDGGIVRGYTLSPDDPFAFSEERSVLFRSTCHFPHSAL